MNGGIGRSFTILAPGFPDLRFPKPNLIVAQPGAGRNRDPWGQMARASVANVKFPRRKPAQKPNLAQIARLSSAEISSSGSVAPASKAASAPAPADLRPKNPDTRPVAGAISGIKTFSP